MSAAAPRRFWREAAVASRDGAWAVELDGRPIRTPAGAPFLAPTRAVAEAAAEEWDAQGDRPDPRSMPLTRAVNTAIDRIAPQHAGVAEAIAAYGGSDLLCYRAPHPDALVARQAEAWDPVLDWAEARWSVALVRVEGVMHAAQPAATLAALRAEVARRDAFALAALHDLTALSGSLLLGLAVVEDALPAEDAWARSRIDETFQVEQWGEDAEAAAAAEAKRADFLAAARFDALLKDRA
ncbi:MAG: ATP12 family protein [Paracoccaceae bacterium]